MQGGTRRKDSYIGHPLPFIWHENSPRVRGYFPQYTKPLMDTIKKQNKTRSRQTNGAHLQGLRRRSVFSSPTRRKERKRGGIRRLGRSSQRRKIRKADRLSKRYFIICTWNCAGANRRDDVLEKMVYDFDVVCLPKKKKKKKNDMPKSGFTVIIEASRSWYGNISLEWSQQDSISSFNLDKWSMRIAGHPNRKTRWKTQIPDSHQCIHPPFQLHHRGKSDFLEDMEDELGDTIRISSDFNARSSL